MKNKLITALIAAISSVGFATAHAEEAKEAEYPIDTCPVSEAKGCGFDPRRVHSHFSDTFPSKSGCCNGLENGDADKSVGFKDKTAPLPTIQIDGKEQLFVTKSQLIDLFAQWPKAVGRMLHASRHGDDWLVIASNKSGKSGSEVRVTAESVHSAYHRLINGEEPPKMPSERSPVPKPLRLLSIAETQSPLLEKVMLAAELLPQQSARVIFSKHANEKIIATVTWNDGSTDVVIKTKRRGRNSNTKVIGFNPSWEET